MNFEFGRGVFLKRKIPYRIFLNKFTKNFHNFFWIYGVFIYFCFEMKMFYFLFKIMCAENVVITKVIGFS